MAAARMSIAEMHQQIDETQKLVVTFGGNDDMPSAFDGSSWTEVDWVEHISELEAAVATAQSELIPLPGRTVAAAAASVVRDPVTQALVPQVDGTVFARLLTPNRQRPNSTTTPDEAEAEADDGADSGSSVYGDDDIAGQAVGALRTEMDQPELASYDDGEYSDGEQVYSDSSTEPLGAVADDSNADTMAATEDQHGDEDAQGDADVQEAVVQQHTASDDDEVVDESTLFELRRLLISIDAEMTGYVSAEEVRCMHRSSPSSIIVHPMIVCALPGRPFHSSLPERYLAVAVLFKHT